jgi:hypothetical protein
MNLIYEELKGNNLRSDGTTPISIGDEVKEGDSYTDRDGDVGTITYFRPPHKPSSSGKISVRKPGAQWDSEYYVGVVGAKWINREDR